MMKLVTDFQRIISQKRISSWLVLLLVALANAAFCRLFKGDFTAMGLVFIATLAGFSVRQGMMKKHVNHLVTFTTSAFVASLLSRTRLCISLGSYT
jgi:uncharacterized membrane protein YjjP (DUF1212 family)